MFKLKLALIKLVIKLSQIVGKGSSFPGMLADKLHFDFSQIDTTNTHVIYVIGTNGKTTTTNFIYQLLKNNNIKVITNHEGANLITGIKTLLLKHTGFNHHIDCDVILLEVDEKTIKYTTKLVVPNEVVVTNFFRDQLDRYGEIDLIVDEIKNELLPYQPQMFLNANDPYIYYQFKAFENKIYYGVYSDADVVIKQHRLSDNYHKVRDLIYCPLCKEPLTYEYFHYGHLGLFSCPCCGISITPKYFLKQTQAGFELDDKLYRFKDLPLYFLFNIISSVSLIKELGLKLTGLDELIGNFKFPPGRNQQTIINNIPVYLNLVKNVVGFEETIDYVLQHFDNYTLVVCLNDNYADGRDISWIYDVYLDDLLAHSINLYTCGTRAYDMALRFELSGYSDVSVIEDIEQCINHAINSSIKPVVIISNYTALPKALNVIKKGAVCKLNRSN